MKRSDVYNYINHRLNAAGLVGQSPFNLANSFLIYKYTKGVPRLINIVCNKCLLLAFGKGNKKIRNQYIYHAVKDTEGIDLPFWHKWLFFKHIGAPFLALFLVALVVF